MLQQSLAVSKHFPRMLHGRDPAEMVAQVAANAHLPECRGGRVSGIADHGDCASAERLSSAHFPAHQALRLSLARLPGLDAGCT